MPQGRLRPGVQRLSQRPDRDLPPLRRHLARRRGARRRGSRGPARPLHPGAVRRLQYPEPVAAEAVVTSSTAAGLTDAASFPGERPVTPEVVREHNLNQLEYGRIVELLGRAPT